MSTAALELAPDFGETLSHRAFRQLLRRPQVVLCFLVIAAYLAVAICGYLEFLPDFQRRVGGSHEAPGLSLARILGTDVFGRSVFYKILAGTQTAITIGFLVTLISVPVGILLGMVAGYYGGKVDALVVWLYSVVVSVPYILLVIAISYVLGKGLFSICVAMGAVSWVGLCRMLRGEVIKHRTREYVLAMRLVGAGDFAIMFEQILPNVAHLIIINASLTVLGAIKSEVILTYLGVGIQSGASWGTMIVDAPGELTNGIWWPFVGVVVSMFLIIYALNVFGDALRDALDPKLVA